ncbi:MAG: helix-turn-helix domain-containing protein, partial [Bdellovibrionales bacterium]|nr:helix-turn-helix domain-containing protein [Bdellovibrionales bacterium]
PIAALIEFIEKRHPEVVGISMTVAESIGQFHKFKKLLGSLSHRPQLLVGGGLFAQTPSLQNELGLEQVFTDASTAVEYARHCCGLGSSPLVLANVLGEIGTRIQSFRKELSLSQKELAQRADLDRAYISALEHGKQNVTVGALCKLANALNVTLEDVIVGQNGRCS